MTTLIMARLIIILLMVTMLIKRVLTATDSAGVTLHLWKAMRRHPKQRRARRVQMALKAVEETHFLLVVWQ
jgi:hypothetical protein